MSQHVAKINGQDVYSDKQVASIVNTKITFTDGSWCDVATGQVVNNGPGSINIGVPGEDGEKTTFGPESYSASRLSVLNLVATDLDVQPHSGSRIEVTITGPKSAVDKIKVTHKGNTVKIEGPSAEIGGSRSGISIVGNVVATNISIGGSSTQSPTKVTVKVPVGTPLNLSYIQGYTTIGDTKGPLNLSQQGSGDVEVGSVTDTNINAQGSCDIDINALNGNLTVSQQGSGDTNVRSGKINLLTIQKMGSGDFEFHGRATNGQITTMGSGDVYIAHIENKPSTSKMGSGKLRVKNW